MAVYTFVIISLSLEDKREKQKSVGRDLKSLYLTSSVVSYFFSVFIFDEIHLYKYVLFRRQYVIRIERCSLKCIYPSARFTVAKVIAVSGSI
jgi:hypothetical protein